VGSNPNSRTAPLEQARARAKAVTQHGRSEGPAKLVAKTLESLVGKTLSASDGCMTALTGAAQDGAGEGGSAETVGLDRRVNEMEYELAEEKHAEPLASSATACSSSSPDRGSGGDSKALHARVARLEKELAEEIKVVKATIAAAATSAKQTSGGPDGIDGENEKESVILRKQLAEMEAALSREKCVPPCAPFPSCLFAS